MWATLGGKVFKCVYTCYYEKKAPGLVGSDGRQWLQVLSLLVSVLYIIVFIRYLYIYVIYIYIMYICYKFTLYIYIYVIIWYIYKCYYIDDITKLLQTGGQEKFVLLVWEGIDPFPWASFCLCKIKHHSRSVTYNLVLNDVVIKKILKGGWFILPWGDLLCSICDVEPEDWIRWMQCILVRMLNWFLIGPLLVGGIYRSPHKKK